MDPDSTAHQTAERNTLAWTRHVSNNLIGSPIDATWCTDPSGRSVATAVLRRIVPYIVEATVIPTALFYTVLIAFELKWAVIAALAWTYSAVLRRIVLRKPIPAVLVLAAFGATMRTLLFLMSGYSFIYLFQSIVRSLAVASFFALSVAVGRPLVARLANDFCAFTPEVEARPAITQLFRRLTYLWAATQGISALTSLTLLMFVPVEVFVGVAAASAWTITWTAIALTVFDAVRTTRRDGLHTAVDPGGRLHAYIAPAV